MAEFALHFRLEDIVSKLKEVHRYGNEDGEFFKDDVTHRLASPVASFMGHGAYLYDPDSDIVLEGIGQSAYVENLCHLAITLSRCVNELMSPLKKKRFPKNDIYEIAKRYYAELERFVFYLPLSAKLSGKEQLNYEQQMTMAILDNKAKDMIYYLNTVFAPEFKKDFFRLKQDLKFFHSENAGDFNQCGITFELAGRINSITTIADYVSNAVSPLVQNVLDHAFNQEKDIYGRVNEDGFRGILEISTSFDASHYYLTVNDNGFGVKPDILKRLFERGATSKPPNSTEHGIGLWSVKRFVVSYGGTITCETELGKGTSFTITIPYHSSDHTRIQATVPTKR